MSEISAALVNSQLKKLNFFVNKRNQIAKTYLKLIKNPKFIKKYKKSNYELKKNASWYMKASSRVVSESREALRVIPAETRLTVYRRFRVRGRSTPSFRWPFSGQMWGLERHFLKFYNVFDMV